ncbi:uncharacterized protein LOC112394584 [Neophocaena asiaeorientalis asiaeorientalis]|uniref:Uncharacterized protein LOC112394584 n=1 Tax=Neophocaena asiaeorientalis asiaeorientalis TaxID=1706337 RepID=A0A341AV09_NEOAA|nr:uncharacterized protein LOC112394584 [Neophocaena asiaeorientalis asiaeorientalis]
MAATTSGLGFQPVPFGTQTHTIELMRVLCSAEWQMRAPVELALAGGIVGWPSSCHGQLKGPLGSHRRTWRREAWRRSTRPSRGRGQLGQVGVGPSWKGTLLRAPVPPASLPWHGLVPCPGSRWVPGSLVLCSGAQPPAPVPGWTSLRLSLSVTSDSALACAPSRAPVEARSVVPVSCGLEGSRAEAVWHVLPGAMMMGSNSGGVTWPPKAQKPLVLRGRAAGPALGQVTRDGAPAPRKVTQGRGLKWVTGTWAPECAGPAATVRTGLPSGQEGRPGEGFEQRISLACVRYRWQGTGEDQVGCGGLNEKGVQMPLVL